MKRHSSLTERLSGSRALIGLLQLYPNQVLLEMAGQCGYDFLLLDGEHGVLSDDDFAHSIRTLAGADVLAMVRLARHDVQAMNRYLKMGADVIVVPHVTTASEANALARAMDSRTGASLIVIIESSLGAANAQAIMEVEGVDGTLVGPNDLTADLGCLGDYTQGRYADALARIERAAAMTGKVLGTVPHGDYSLAALRQRGHRLFVLGTDRSLINEAMTVQVTKARSVLDAA